MNVPVAKNSHHRGVDVKLKTAAVSRRIVQCRITVKEFEFV
jgi:hypothetical protein